MTHFEPCSQRNGGACEKSDLADYARTLTYNMYAQCRCWKTEFPIFLEFEHSEGGRLQRGHVFLGRLIGAGALAFVSKAICTDGPDGNIEFAELQFDASPDGQTSFPLASHTYFVRFLSETARLLNVDVRGITSLAMRRCKFEQDDSTNRFRVHFTSVECATTVSCTTKVELRKRKKDGASGALPFGLGSGVGSSFAVEHKDKSGK